MPRARSPTHGVLISKPMPLFEKCDRRARAIDRASAANLRERLEFDAREDAHLLIHRSIVDFGRPMDGYTEPRFDKAEVPKS